jgi:hypothetical protein
VPEVIRAYAPKMQSVIKAKAYQLIMIKALRLCRNLGPVVTRRLIITATEVTIR